MPSSKSQQQTRHGSEGCQRSDNHKSIGDSHSDASSSRLEYEGSFPRGMSIDHDDLSSSYSLGSTSSAGRYSSHEPSALEEDFDIGDYNAPPRALSTSQSLTPSGADRCARDGRESDPSAGCREPSAVEGLRAIQVELIPGYENGDVENSQPELEGN